MKVIGKVLVTGGMETNNLKLITLDNIGLVKVIDERRLLIWNKSNGIVADVVYPSSKEALDAYVVIINALAGLTSHHEIFIDYDVSDTRSVNHLCLKQRQKKTD